MPDISAALTVEGWMSEAELTWLAEQAQRHSVIVEVGSWMGRTTIALADNCLETVYAVDTWNGSEEHKKTLSGRPADWLFETFKQNVGDRIAEGLILPIRWPSVQAAANFGATADMVFIDAAHDYDNARADISAWRKVLKPGGLLCGHDYDAGRPGVVKAVNELVPKWKKGPGSIWFEG